MNENLCDIISCYLFGLDNFCFVFSCTFFSLSSLLAGLATPFFDIYYIYPYVPTTILLPIDDIPINFHDYPFCLRQRESFINV